MHSCAKFLPFRHLAVNVRIKIVGIFGVTRNWSNFEDRFVRTDFCGQSSYSSLDNDNNKVLLSVYTLEIKIL